MKVFSYNNSFYETTCVTYFTQYTRKTGGHIHRPKRYQSGYESTSFSDPVISTPRTDVNSESYVFNLCKFRWFFLLCCLLGFFVHKTPMSEITHYRRCTRRSRSRLDIQLRLYVILVSTTVQ